MEPKVEFNPIMPIESIESLTKDPSVIKMFVNGFQCQVNLTDANVVLKQNNVSLAVVVMTLSAVKSLHTQLGTLMENYTKLTGQEILSFDELNAIASKNYEKIKK